jgi:hypothetical protein
MLYSRCNFSSQFMSQLVYLDYRQRSSSCFNVPPFSLDYRIKVYLYFASATLKIFFGDGVGPDIEVSHIEFTIAQFSHRIVSEHSVKQVTSTICTLYTCQSRGTVRVTEERNFVINHNESDLYRLNIELGSPDSQSNTLPLLSL